MKFVIFDDKKREYLYPLTFTRPIGDLRVGILKLRQRLAAYFDIEEYYYLMDKQLQPLYEERHPEWKINKVPSGDCIFINSRLKINDELVETIKQMPKNSAFLIRDNIVAARFGKRKGQFFYQDLWDKMLKLDLSEPKAELWQYSWEFIQANGKYIERDFQDFFYDKDNFFETETGITVLNPYNIWIGEGAEIKPGAIIDATDGPVIIDEGAKIMHNAVIIGPVYVGKRSTIKVAAKIYEGTTIGPHCKVGGEVEDTIFQAYSNKQHDGFLGHSYVAEWVNIGADTNNSDLKNSYKNVYIYSYPHDHKIDSGSMFMGVIIADHVKIAINSTINTGTIIGLAANLFGYDIIAHHIQDFKWGEAGDLERYRLIKFFETAEIVKKRRNLSLSEKEKELYEELNKQLY